MNLLLPTEPIGSLPRPPPQIDALRRSAGDAAELGASCTAALGTGSEFTLLIPASRIPHQPASATGPDDTSTADPAYPGSRILIADDNRDMADSLALYMQLRGHEVTTVYSGEQAIEAFLKYHPSIVILDIGMPKLNGYETARQIRACDPERTVLLLALTGWGQDNDKRLAMDAGFDHHFTKPVNPEKLAAVFERP